MSFYFRFDTIEKTRKEQIKYRLVLGGNLKMKRIVISVIALVLLFELFLFLTDKTTKSYKEKDRQSVYTVSLLEKEEEFKKDYQEVILGEEENSVMILMSQKELEEIKQKYKITIEN